MFGLQILDIAIGLIFVYLMLALTCTAVSELIAGLLDRRTENLKIGIRNLLNPDTKKLEGIVGEFYQLPLIRSLYEGKSEPSYIPARTFAIAIRDLINVKSDAANFKKSVTDIIKDAAVPDHLKESLQALWSHAGGDLDKFQANIETWFNEAMDRVSAWYKQRTQTLIFILALVVTGLANADTLQIARDLSNNPALREALVAQAQEYVKAEEAKPAQPSNASQVTPQDQIKKNIETLQGLGIQLGWKDWPDNWYQDPKSWLRKFLGLLLTALAVSLGAPFWFDMLKKIMNIRSAGKSPREIKEKEAKKPGVAS